jgi:hypothetical protein
MYNGALADMRLGLNPYTGNRYAFAGGNPITGIELDGHIPCSTEVCDDPPPSMSSGPSPCTNFKECERRATAGSPIGAGPGSAWGSLKDCGAPGVKCSPPGSGKQGIKEHLKWIVEAAEEAKIDPRLLIAVLIFESIGDRSGDAWKADLPSFVGTPTIGMANMNEPVFTSTVEKHPILNPTGGDVEDLWDTTVTDNRLSIRAAAYHLRDLMDAQRTRKGSGLAYSSEELAAIGYNAGVDMMNYIATGRYSEVHHRPGPMGPMAAHYLGGVRSFLPEAQTWLCDENVLDC